MLVESWYICHPRVLLYVALHPCVMYLLGKKILEMEIKELKEMYSFIR